MKSQDMSDLLHGSIWKKVLIFALPLALTSVLQQLFSAADVAVLGTFVGKHAMAAVGSNSAVVGLIVNLFVGVSVGSNVVLSRLTGQNDAAGVNKTAHTSIVLALISGLIIAIIGNLIAVPIVNILEVPADIAPLSVKYLRVYFTGMPFIMLYNFESSIFRSQGDTRTPLVCLTISGITNIVLNLFFVLVIHMDVDGVALATVIANFFSSALLFYFLRKSDKDVKIEFKDLKVDKAITKNILKIGVPSGLQGVIFSISNLLIQSAVNSLGADAMAGGTAAFNLEIMAYFVINAFGQAAVTFIGQNYGARNYERCKQILKQTILLNWIAALVISAVMIAFGKDFLALFNNDPEVINYGYIRVVILMLGESVNVIIETLSGAMRGYGHSLTPAIVTFVAVCGVRIMWVYTMFKIYGTWFNLMLVYPVSWAISAVFMVYAYFKMMKKILPDGVRVF